MRNLRNDDGNGNENGKKAIGLDYKTTNSCQDSHSNSYQDSNRNSYQDSCQDTHRNSHKILAKLLIKLQLCTCITLFLYIYLQCESAFHV